MRSYPLFTLSLLYLLSTGQLAAAESEILTRSLTSWNGGEFYYPEGVPEVTAAKIRLEAGEQTVWHCHPVPLFAYVLQGRLEVATDSGQYRVFNKGDAFVEVMNTLHRGTAIKGPVVLIAFYAGALGVDNTVLLSSGDSCTDS